ncbi:hypothetical protein SAY86_007824 [Trapa natans]|uniref:Uncharacterized protein n=1 Tax=Trapa natans TaxID=22666 RepID=A0AAN7LE33_TRANT|nr:hypothetical protein SAY86_007824 [Trapa natans]
MATLDIIKTTNGVLRGVRRAQELHEASNPIIVTMHRNSSESENTMVTNTGSWVSGQIEIDYYEGESSAPPMLQLIPPNQGRELMSLQEGVGWFQGGNDMAMTLLIGEALEWWIEEVHQEVPPYNPCTEANMSFGTIRAWVWVGSRIHQGVHGTPMLHTRVSDTKHYMPTIYLRTN